MRVLMRLGTMLMLLAVGLATAPIARAAAPVDEALRHRVERRFEVLPVRGGIVLTPKRHGDVKSIEIRDGVIALNGEPATGSELREKLGDDAELVLQVSYLSSETLAHWDQPAAAAPPASPQEPSPAAPEWPTMPSRLRSRLACHGLNSPLAVFAAGVETKKSVASFVRGTLLPPTAA